MFLDEIYEKEEKQITYNQIGSHNQRCLLKLILPEQKNTSKVTWIETTLHKFCEITFISIISFELI